MTFENKDRLTELQHTLKQTKAIFDLFVNEFAMDNRKEAVLTAITANFENYQNTASVITDLIYKANQQAEELDTETDKERIKAV